MPNTREKLIEVKNALAMCYKQGLTSECEGCRYKGRESICMDALMEDALAVINCLEEKQATSNWIPVTERLPDTFGEYIVAVQDAFGKRYSDYADYDPYELYWRTGLHRGVDEMVTHWMPLPEAPKGE